jgi:hypothetical protein
VTSGGGLSAPDCIYLAAAHLNRMVLSGSYGPHRRRAGAPPSVVSILLEERPKMFRKVALLTAALAVWVMPALAQSPLPPLPFPPLPMPQGSPEERAACAPDVHKFCGSDLQDTMRVLACLQANRPKISAACNRVLVSHGQ